MTKRLYEQSMLDGVVLYDAGCKSRRLLVEEIREDLRLRASSRKYHPATLDSAVISKVDRTTCVRKPYSANCRAKQA